MAKLKMTRGAALGFDYIATKGVSSRFSRNGIPAWASFYEINVWGVNLGGAIHASDSHAKWEKGTEMSIEDSMYRAKINYEAGKGDTSEFGSFLRKYSG
ncbi:hypothetical protein [Sanyastnella coralliicola]|uniref:hypothetical protein n=1 Tax=Sanyastnella coralliicola TaxID=3069118 RepID=UPI0027BAA7CE|nr:hypothetical protein [Longitalea sp. SCSIO 12813]